MRATHYILVKGMILWGLASFFLTPVFLSAQQKLSDVRVIVRDVRQEKDSVRVILEIEAIGVSVSAREQMYLFPVIKSGMTQRRMLPVVINGKTQDAVMKRAEKLSGVAEPVYASFSTKGRKLFHEKVFYNSTVPLESWMKEAQIAMVQERRNCRCESHHASVEIIASSIRFMEKPERTIAYLLPVRFMTPPREEIKRRTESGEAQIIYTVGNAEIKPALGNNSGELDKIRRSIENIRGVEGVKINSIAISSYASPEGTWQSNLSLSERRAASLTTWIRRNYDLAGITLSSHGYGEDWDRLAELVENDAVMTSSEKEDILRIIERAELQDGRDKLLVQYKGGNAYRYMLSNLFPVLRRSAYKIEFTVPEYTIETVKKVYKTHPNMLSLYEFYLLANLYEPDSPEFREVITKASTLYPDEKVNRISMATFNLLSKNTVAAMEFLKGLEEDPDAWLYFSMVYAIEADLEKAAHYAQRAADAGNPGAAQYLEKIMDYQKEEEKYQQELEEWKKYGTE